MFSRTGPHAQSTHTSTPTHGPWGAAHLPLLRSPGIREWRYHILRSMVLGLVSGEKGKSGCRHFSASQLARDPSWLRSAYVGPHPAAHQSLPCASWACCLTLCLVPRLTSGFHETKDGGEGRERLRESRVIQAFGVAHQPGASCLLSFMVLFWTGRYASAAASPRRINAPVSKAA